MTDSNNESQQLPLPLLHVARAIGRPILNLSERFGRLIRLANDKQATSLPSNNKNSDKKDGQLLEVKILRDPYLAGDRVKPIDSKSSLFLNSAIPTNADSVAVSAVQKNDQFIQLERSTRTPSPLRGDTSNLIDSPTPEPTSIELHPGPFTLSQSQQPGRQRHFTRKHVSDGSKGSDPNLWKLWQGLALGFFPERPELLNYRVVWSGRPQRRTLASCNIFRKRINVAREMNHPDGEPWLEPLLYHEMCHAVIGYREVQSNVGYTVKKKRIWHGREFRSLERQHPLFEPFDQWVKAGGFSRLVRSDRAKRNSAKRWLSKDRER